MDLNRRNTHRAAIIRADTFSTGAEFEPQTVIQLKTRLRALRESYSRFLEEHQSVVEEAAGEEAMNEQNNFAGEVEEIYIRTVARISGRIEALEFVQIPQPAIIAGAQGVAQEPVRQPHDIRLESIRPTKFNGDYSCWNEWRAMYDSLIHNQTRLSSTEKFHYLKRSLSDSAEQVLSGWQAVGDNYQAAYDSLVQVYENNYRITMAHLDTLTSMPKQSVETHEALRNMIDTMNRVTRQLTVTGSPVEQWGHFLVYTLIAKMPPRTLTQWETSQDLNEMPSLQDVLRFLERRARGIVNLAANQAVKEQKQKEKASTSYASGARPKEQPAEKTANNKIKCFKCSGNHPIYRCPDVLSKSIAERKTIVRNLQLCANCFQKTHAAGSAACRAGACKICKREFHNSILCTGVRNVVAVTTNANSTSSGNSEQNDSNQNFH